MARTFRVIVRGKAHTVEVEELSQSPIIVRVNGESYEVQLEEKAPVEEARLDPAEAPALTPVKPQAGKNEAAPASTQIESAAVAPQRGVVAFLPGMVLSVTVKPGDVVKRGDEVCVIESMKMEQSIKSDHDGRVKEVRVAQGQTVRPGLVLIELE